MSFSNFAEEDERRQRQQRSYYNKGPHHLLIIDASDNTTDTLSFLLPYQSSFYSLQSNFNMTSISYYDIDEILAEEELMPVTNNFDFTCLVHLDPDYVHSNSNSNSNSSPQEEPHKISKPQSHCLSEGTKFKMPLWSIQKWAQLGFLRLQFPKHFGRRARERLDADPVSVDLRYASFLFYLFVCLYVYEMWAGGGWSLD